MKFELLFEQKEIAKTGSTFDKYQTNRYEVGQTGAEAKLWRKKAQWIEQKIPSNKLYALEKKQINKQTKSRTINLLKPEVPTFIYILHILLWIGSVLFSLEMKKSMWILMMNSKKKFHRFESIYQSSCIDRTKNQFFYSGIVVVQELAHRKRSNVFVRRANVSVEISLQWTEIS